MTGELASTIAAETGQAAPRAEAAGGDSRVGLLDIGSSSIRLVIYRAGGRLPHPQFNEREVCRLGAGLGETGRLDPERISHALDTLQRFAVIAGNSDLDRLEVFATEAVRKASNKADFLDPAEAVLGCRIRLLSGDEEARYAALGVISGFAGVDGVVADLGGGSLELQPIEDSVPRAMPPGETSLPLGHLRPLGPEQVDRTLRSLGWIKEARGQRLYVVGGTLRAIATAYSSQSRKRLDLVHGLVLPVPELVEMIDAIEEVDGQMQGIPPARRPSMKQAILVMRSLLLALEPSEVVFSGYGAREGILYETFGARKLADDPLIAGAREYAELWERHDGMGEALERAMSKFAAVMPPRLRRLARACALLADVTWHDFPDYRGPLAAEKMLGLSVVGITHAERIWMAAVLFIRYRGVFPDRGIFKGNKLTSKERELASYTGLVLRMLMNLTGGLPGLIDGLRIENGKKRITLVFGAEAAGLRSELFHRRLEAVARFSPVEITVR